MFRNYSLWQDAETRLHLVEELDERIGQVSVIYLFISFGFQNYLINELMNIFYYYFRGNLLFLLMIH